MSENNNNNNKINDSGVCCSFIEWCMENEVKAVEAEAKTKELFTSEAFEEGAKKFGNNSMDKLVLQAVNPTVSNEDLKDSLIQCCKEGKSAEEATVSLMSKGFDMDDIINTTSSLIIELAKEEEKGGEGGEEESTTGVVGEICGVITRGVDSEEDPEKVAAALLDNYSPSDIVKALSIVAEDVFLS